MPLAVQFGIIFIVRAGMQDLVVVDKVHVPRLPFIIQMERLDTAIPALLLAIAIDKFSRLNAAV